MKSDITILILAQARRTRWAFFVLFMIYAQQAPYSLGIFRTFRDICPDEPYLLGIFRTFRDICPGAPYSLGIFRTFRDICPITPYSLGIFRTFHDICPSTRRSMLCRDIRVTDRLAIAARFGDRALRFRLGSTQQAQPQLPRKIVACYREYTAFIKRKTVLCLPRAHWLASLFWYIAGLFLYRSTQPFLRITFAYWLVSEVAMTA